jgi:hypothetical protein
MVEAPHLGRCDAGRHFWDANHDKLLDLSWPIILFKRRKFQFNQGVFCAEASCVILSSPGKAGEGRLRQQGSSPMGQMASFSGVLAWEWQV